MKSGFFVLRCVCIGLVTIMAGFLIWALKNELYRVYAFGIAVLFYLFGIGELNIKPINASANIEIKK